VSSVCQASCEGIVEAKATCNLPATYVVASGAGSLSGATKADYDAATAVLNTNLPVLLQFEKRAKELLSPLPDLVTAASTTYAAEADKLGPRGVACLSAIVAAIQEEASTLAPSSAVSQVLAAFGF
jgi:hypothetical protein